MRDLTKGNIYKTFLIFAVPMVLAGVLSQCYSVINTIIAGKLLGDNALAAIGAISPLETFINSAFWGYGTGVGIYTAQLFGAKRYERMKSVIISNNIFISIVIFILSLFLVLFRSNVFAILEIDASIIDDCNGYFVINMLCKAIALFAINCVYLVNGMGDSRFPFLMSLISATLNIAFSVLLVTVFKTGVEGMAIANAFSYLVIAVLYLLKIKKDFKELGILGVKVPINFSSVKETFRFSAFSMLQQSVMYFAGFLLSPMVNSIGAAASASYTVTLRIYDVNASIYQNSAKTLGSYTAQCYGARKYAQIRKGIKVSFLQNCLFVLPVLLCCIFLSTSVASLFYTKEASPVSVGYTVDFLRFCMPFLICNIAANLYHSFFRGIGDMKALFVTTLSGSVARIIVGKMLILPFGIYGYYAGWVLSWIIDGLVGILIYRFGGWRKIFAKPQS